MTWGISAAGWAGIAIVGSTAANIGNSIYQSRHLPDIPSAPPPASYYNYDADGNPTGSQVWDPAKNAYVYKSAPLTDAQKADKTQRDALRSTLISNMSKTPEDRLKAYDDYAASFSDSMHRDVDRRFANLTSSTDESMAARGLLGSKAYVDATNENNKDKLAQDTDIAAKAQLAKQDLANTDRTYDLNTLNALDQNANTTALTALQAQQNAQQGANLGTSATLAQATLDSSNTLKQWDAKMTQYNDLSKNLTNTSTGLAFLYGYNKGGVGVNPSTSPIKPTV